MLRAGGEGDRRSICLLSVAVIDRLVDDRTHATADGARIGAARHDLAVPDDALPVGAYSELVTERLATALDNPELSARAVVTALRSADAADRYGRHVSSLVARIVDSSNDATRVEEGATLLSHLVDLLKDLVPGSDVADDRLSSAAEAAGRRS